jgi:hypothetical protein
MTNFTGIRKDPDKDSNEKIYFTKKIKKLFCEYHK